MGRMGRKPQPHLHIVLCKLDAVMAEKRTGYGKPIPLSEAVDPLSERYLSPEFPGYMFGGKCAEARRLYRQLVRDTPFPAGSPRIRKISQLWTERGWRTTMAYKRPGKEGVHRLDIWQLTQLVWGNQGG